MPPRAISMRNDATEAALGLLGLTGTVSFATKTTTINANGTITNGIRERDRERERAATMKRKTSSNSNSSVSTTATAAFSLPLPHAHTSSHNHRRRGSIPPPTPSDDGDGRQTLSSSATAEPARSFATTATNAPHATTSTTTAGGRGARTEAGTGAGDDDAADAINCICGFTYDDGFSIACDDCSRWVHAACFDIVEGGVPEEWRCWVCEPRRVDRERAVRIQRARLKVMRGGEGANGGNTNGVGGGRRRVSSPGVDRKRRASAAAIDGGAGAKRKRRYSVNTSQQHPAQHSHPQPAHQHQQQPPNAEDEHVDIEEPAAAAHTYIHIENDIIPHASTRDRLQRAARHWRGVVSLDGEHSGSPVGTTASTATSTSTSTPALPSAAHLATPVLLPPSAFHSPPYTALHPLPPTAAALPAAFAVASPIITSPTAGSDPTTAATTSVSDSVRPPTYAVHTTQAVRSAGLIAPFTAAVVPSAAYLADPLNAYAHLGLPKPFVHLMGPPLDVALDARLAGNGARFVRSGCRPNAVLRPVLCHPKEDESERKGGEDSLAFGVFALRDLKANEEVVLGWEWDDGSVIHHLPALIDSPYLFAYVSTLPWLVLRCCAHLLTHLYLHFHSYPFCEWY